jgi:hypothetical protein
VRRLNEYVTTGMGSDEILTRAKLPSGFALVHDQETGEDTTLRER